MQRVERREESMAEWLTHWTLVLRVLRSRPTRFSWHFVSLDKALYSNCSVAWLSRKAVSPIWSTFYTLSDVKERHGLFKKSRGILPVPLTVCQNMSLPLGPDWARAVVARLSPPLLSLIQLLAVQWYEERIVN